MAKETRFNFNHLYAPVFATKARYILAWGGRARGGSHFGTDYFLYKMAQPDYFRGVFLRAVLGDVRASLWQDFKDRMEAANLQDEFRYSEAMVAVHRATGNNVISKGFKKSSGNQSAKLKSIAGVTHILIEEAEEVDEEDFNKLDDGIRTTKAEVQIILLFNPPHKNHWLIKRFFNLVDSGMKDEKGNPIPYYRAVPKAIKDALVIHSTYLDNIKNINQKTIEKYKAYGTPGNPFYNRDKYFIDVLGLVPEGNRGRIYRKFIAITDEFFDSLPYESYYGLDFGYSDDPVALVELKTHNNRNFWRQTIYESGLTNPALVRLMRARGVPLKARIYADSAEPKSIQEIKDLGYVHVIPAEKGPDSVLYGIKKINSMENYMTESSVDGWREVEEYKWQLDRNKEPTDTPVPGYDHLMDAGKYGIITRLKIKRAGRMIIAGESESNNPLDWLSA